MSRKIIAKGTSGTLAVLISRLTGLARDMLIARFLGGGAVMSAWVLAFRVPNTFRGLLGEGAATQALIPLLGQTIHKEGITKFRQDLGIILATLAMILGIISTLVSSVCVCIMPYFPVYRVNAALALMPILMPYTFFVCLTSICASVLNLFDKYFLPMLTSVLLNVAIIVSILIFYHKTPENLIVKMSWASLISGGLQLGWLLYLLKKEDIFPTTFKPGGWKTPVVKEFFTLAIPRFFGAAATQISALMDSFMALYISSFAAPALYFTERVVFLPIGLFAVSLGNVCLVSMTKHVSENRADLLVKDLSYGLKQILYISVPMAFLFLFYRHQILNLVYGGNRFGEDSINETAWAMLFYCFGIPAFCAIKVISSAFYAQKDTKTPVRIGLWCIMLNFAINLILMFPLKQGGIALGTAMSSLVNCLILTHIFKKRYPMPGGRSEVLICFFKTSFASLIAILISMYLGSLSNTPTFIKLIDWKGIVSLCLNLALFCIVYFTVNYLLKSDEQRDWAMLITSRLGISKKPY